MHKEERETSNPLGKEEKGMFDNILGCEAEENAHLHNVNSLLRSVAL